MSIKITGASYPPRTVAEWHDASNPLEKARADIRGLAEQGHPLASRIVQIEKAMKEKKRAEFAGEEVPSWVRESLSWLDEYQPNENLDDALAALKAALN